MNSADRAQMRSVVLWLSILMSLLGVIVGIAAGALMFSPPTGPDCHAEDMCVAQYDGNAHAWVIRQVTP